MRDDLLPSLSNRSGGHCHDECERRHEDQKPDPVVSFPTLEPTPDADI